MNGQIEKALQSYIKPRDEVGFKNLLRDSVSFKINPALKDNDPDLSNFEYIYEAANIYQHWFAKVYTFLATAPRINLKAIPRMSTRGDGIIAIFMSKLPPTFADNIRSLVTHTTEYAQLSDFLDVFNERIRELHECLLESKMVSGTLTKYIDVSASSHVKVVPTPSRTECTVQALMHSTNVPRKSYHDDGLTFRSSPPPSYPLDDSEYTGRYDGNVMALDPSDNPSEKRVYGCLNIAAFGCCTSQYCKKSHKESNVATGARY
jgi:hypothetical protein